MQAMQLHFSPGDGDYVGHFQALAAVHVQIDQHGATPSLLVQQANLEIDVSNFVGARRAARQAARLAPDTAEPAFVEGLACLLLSMQAVGIVPGAAGAERPRSSARALLEEAASLFDRACTLNPGDDEAQEGAALVRALLHHQDDDGLEAAMADVIEQPEDAA